MRRVYFSFHYDRDIRRVVQIRNSWIVRAGNETQPFGDHADWESIMRKDDPSIQRWIESQMTGASVTVVLIGAETYGRKWVRYEIKRSYELGKGLLGVFIHNVKDPVSGGDYPGSNPLHYWTVERNGRKVPFSELYRTYDWIRDNGYSNFSRWIEDAAKAVGR